jgi:hypothetical protein
MNAQYQNRLDLMIANREELKKLTWANGYARHFMAMYLAQKEVRPDIGRILEINRFTKQNTGVFSSFRAESMYFMSAVLSLEPDYPDVFDRIQTAYQKLRDIGFHSSSFLTIAAYVIATGCNADEMDRVTGDMRRLYDELKSSHPLITGYDDYASIAVLAVSGKDVMTIAARMEQLYQLLDADLHMFGQRNTLQSLCAILALSDEDAASVALKYIDAVRICHEKGIRPRFGTYTTLSTLVLLSNELISDVSEACEGESYLRHMRGFGNFALNKDIRFSLAGNILLSAHQNKYKWQTAGSAVHMISLIMAQQAAMIAASSAAAASAASSSSN